MTASTTTIAVVSVLMGGCLGAFWILLILWSVLLTGSCGGTFAVGTDNEQEKYTNQFTTEWVSYG